MWLFTKRGFYSIIRKSDGEWHVRARVKEDLESLNRLVGAGHTIHTTPDADYRYRIVCRGEDARKMIEVLAADIDYSNFKARICSTPDQADRLAMYNEIWGMLYGFQQWREKQ